MLPTTVPAGRRRGRPAGAPGAVRMLGVLAALWAYLLGTAGPAAAHAVLSDSGPASGAVVSSAPEQVTLTFSESVRFTDDSVRVLDPAGERADTGDIRELDAGAGAGSRYGAPLRDDLPDGTYTVAWRAVSADSHPISGAFTFSVGAPSDTSVVLPERRAGGGTVGLLYDLARYASYAGFLLLVGGAAFVLACWPQGAGVRAVQRVVTTGWVGLTTATLAMLVLRAPYTGSGELADAFDLGALSEVVDTKTGTALVARLLLLATAALFTAVLFGTYRADDEPGRRAGGEPVPGPGPGRRRDVVTGLALGGTVIATGLATTWAAAGHASTGIQTGVALPVDVLHLLAVAAWLGGLATLTAALWSGTGAVPRSAVRRFSRTALGSVTVLAATGLYQSWRQVGTWSALTGTDYGRLLLLKVALVAVLVTFGWSSRRWTGRLTEPSREAADPPVPAEVRAGGVADADGPAGADPARTAQLARQRQAVAAARLKRTRDADPHRSRLRRSVLSESAVAVVILAVATLLTGTEPARTAGTGTGGGAAPGPAAGSPTTPRTLAIPFDTGGPRGRGTAHVTLDPGRPGRNALGARLVGPDGKPIDVPEVRASFTLPAKDFGPLRVTPRETGDGVWSAEGLQLPVPGDWEMALTVRTSDIDQVTETRKLRIR